MVIAKFQRKDFINLHFNRMQSWYRRRCLGSSFHARITKTKGFVPGGHERVLIQGHAEDKAYCIHARGSHAGLTMSQIKMRVHAHAEFCLMPPVTIFETTHGGNVLDARSTIGWSWRTAGRVAASVDPEPTQRDNYHLLRGHPGISRLERSTHFEHLTVAWLTSKSADPRSERLAPLSITDLLFRFRYRSANQVIILEDWMLNYYFNYFLVCYRLRNFTVSRAFFRIFMLIRKNKLL